MNKEEFQTKKNDINSKIRELKSQKIKLEKEYIESNMKYPIGSKVCITTNESKRYAYVKGYRIDFSDNIEPLFKKINKDGSVSKVSLYVNLENVVIELVQGHE